MIISKRKAFILIIILSILLLTSCTTKAPKEPKPLKEPISRNELILGTVISIKLYDEVEEDIFDLVFDRLREIENKMTINGENSEVIQVNLNSGKDFVKVSEDTFYVVEKGIHFSSLSNGRFDISIGPLVKLWNIGTEAAKVPSQDDIDKKAKLVNYKDVILDSSTKSVKLKNEGMILDLGAIAKGYAADEAVRILKENNIKRGILNLGGNIFAYGSKDENSPWKIGIQNPFSTRGEYIGLVNVADKTVVTSGIYERYFEENGVRYHHILDPETGYPVENSLAGVSIIADSSIDADALSTSVFSLGLDKGMVLIESLENVEAVFVTKESKVYISSGLEDNFKLTDKNFKLIE